jgi:hypothetical protein
MDCAYNERDTDLSEIVNFSTPNWGVRADKTEAIASEPKPPIHLGLFQILLHIIGFVGLSHYFHSNVLNHWRKID